ncbi:uncharacterized protein ARMOST_18234 [Armillaria ostoyae]|uniref:Uncharacterized protein n=1 Tax=Armillaria ostoyae TaxID=47428 RepID=A0A284S1C0_ARMOS|nr:uncharacterized protein ARMOST_18234 [Armillaria ostoyae]
MVSVITVILLEPIFIGGNVTSPGLQDIHRNGPFINQSFSEPMSECCQVFLSLVKPRYSVYVSAAVHDLRIARRVTPTLAPLWKWVYVKISPIGRYWHCSNLPFPGKMRNFPRPEYHILPSFALGLSTGSVFKCKIGGGLRPCASVLSERREVTTMTIQFHAYKCANSTRPTCPQLILQYRRRYWLLRIFERFSPNTFYQICTVYHDTLQRPHPSQSPQPMSRTLSQ